MEENASKTPNQPAKSSTGAVENEKLWAASAYVIFFLPILVAKESKLAMFHAGQGTNLFILSLAVMILGSVVPFLGWFVIGPIGTLVIIAFAIMGIINASNGEMKELPLIGKYKVLEKFLK